MSQKVLSIQSHVTHGYVGNRAATFPLQCLGWDVDVLNTVNFSNHTGYGSVKGSPIEPQMLKDIYGKLKELGINEYNCLLTGYVPNRELLAEIEALGHDLKHGNAKLFWLLDPVMGDNGVMYVSSTVVAAYQKILKSGIVSAITPNQFELGLLLGHEVSTMESMEKALDVLHNQHHVEFVVITSMKFDATSDQLFCVSSRAGEEPSIIEISPVIEGYFTGVGDLSSALMMDKIYCKVINGNSLLADVVREVMITMNGVLQITKSAAEKESGGLGSGLINKKDMKYRELRIIDSRHLFRD